MDALSLKRKLSTTFVRTGILNANVIAAAKNYNLPAVRKNDLNIPPPADENAILRMEIELRDKNQPTKKHGRNKAKHFEATDLSAPNVQSVDVSMEKVRWCFLLTLRRIQSEKNYKLFLKQCLLEFIVERDCDEWK